jgi:hypothetical protein
LGKILSDFCYKLGNLVTLTPTSADGGKKFRDVLQLFLNMTLPNFGRRGKRVCSNYKYFTGEKRRAFSKAE